MAAMQEQYDSAFLGILQNEGQIAKFLDAYFSFLYRRTDFYIEMKSKTDKLGFPPGIAQKLAFNAFMKYAEMAKIDKDRREKVLQEREKKSSIQSQGVQEAEGPLQLPIAVEEVEVATSHTLPAVDEGGSDDKTLPKSSTSSIPSSQKTHEQSKAIPETINKQSGVKKKTEDTKEEKEDERKEKVYQADPEAYNGAVRENYTWSQSITDADVRIFVPKNIVKGKDVKVEIQKKHLIASHKGPTGDWVEVVNGPLTWDINKEESMWSLVPGEHIYVCLEKIQERWWEAVLENEEKINVRKIDPSRPITDLDDEAQAKIGEMMYNEQRKRMGLPQSHEEKMHDVLKKAWDAEGSPFKGQPFDPSKVNVTGNNMMSPNM